MDSSWAGQISEKVIQPLRGDGNGSKDKNPTPSHETNLQLSDPPYDNHFYSDRNVSAQVVVTSPQNDSDLSIIGPRFIVAWPAGNSGACVFFQPENGKNGSLDIKIVNSTVGSPLAPVHIDRENAYPSLGVQGVIEFSSKAVLSTPILGSIRAIRDFTEGPSFLYPKVQEGVRIKEFGENGVSVTRRWFDNVTTTTLTFEPRGSHSATVGDDKTTFEKGEYLFSAHINYPQLERLGLHDVLKDERILEEHPKETKALSFLSYSDKILAGGWRFLTYFGRDNIISTLLLQPILSDDAVEAVIASVLERVNRTDGSACHEETIGDWATFMNLQEGNGSTEFRCDYSMVDTDFFVPVLVQTHFVGYGAGLDRMKALLSRPAGQVDPSNKGLTYGDLFTILAEKIMNSTAAFASPGGQTRANLIRLKDGKETGNWRDSIYGLGGGRIPFDVNVGLAPSALKSIASLSRNFDTTIFGEHAKDWAEKAEAYAQVWEDKTIDFFKVVIPAATMRERLKNFVEMSSYYKGPSHAEYIDHDFSYHTLALEGNNGHDMVPVLNTDVAVRLLTSNGTNQERLTEYMNNTALSILRPYPAGLMTPVGMVVANPAVSGNEMLMQNFSNSAYHGSVVWSWQLVAMAVGLEKQLERCNSREPPHFCGHTTVHENVKNAYNSLWDSIEQNRDSLSDEIWSWKYEDGAFKKAALGSLPPPPGTDGVAESDIIQLWSLTFLAVYRNEKLR